MNTNLANCGKDLNSGKTMRKVMMIGLVLALLMTIMKTQSFLLDTVYGAGEMRPFPQQVSYSGMIKPNHVTQAAMNASVASYYDYWKGKYLKNNLASLPGGYYVKGEITGSSGGFVPLGTSEGQGYGMIITALMAGHDANAKTIYDGLFKTARAFKSSVNSNLMGWVVADHVNAQGHFSSATDGDLDIAYSLILAHNQWGSGGSINYLQEAVKMINAIKSSNVTNNNRLNLGDWDSKTTHNSRPSDWMMSHLRAFHEVTGDNTWLNVINALYTAYSQVSNTYAPTTGLISDFIINSPAQPAPEWFLNEFQQTNQYYYNAARVPLRMVMDYAMYGETRGKTIADKISTWIKGATNNNPANVKAGYSLSGTALNTYSSAVFTSPFISGATASSGNQAWVNAGWDYMKNAKSSYFSDSYNMLNLLYISGNWWKPTAQGGGSTSGVTLPVVSDTYVRGGTYSTINYSTETSMTVKKNDPNLSFARQGYLKFIKSSVSGPITSAKIRLYVESVHSNAAAVPIRAFGIYNNMWSEASITFANQPTEAGVSQGSATATATPGYIYLDVTSFVNSQSSDTVSFRIVGIDHDAGAVLATKENSTSSKRPVLLINGG
ncbi:hypothetical protein D3P07_04455 [Paenibacillus sp. 1011MAR3C5]|nr:hypothetical protein D3P07_04455 [Paenibacillus sp. 1011MAR3C5]